MTNNQFELLTKIYNYTLVNWLEPTVEEQSIIEKVKYELDNRTYEIDSLNEDYINEMGYYPKSGDIRRLVDKMSDAYCEQDKSIEFNALVELCDFTRHHKCTICGKKVVNGFHTIGDDEDFPFPIDLYYCSKECLHKHLTEEEWKTLSEEEPEEFYYSEWR